MAAMEVAVSVVCVVITTWCVKVLYEMWWRPKMIAKQLRAQGVHVLPYKLFSGNTRETAKHLSRESRSDEQTQQLPPHDILPRLNPFLHQMVTTHKNEFIVWQGATPQLTISNPKLIREVLLNKLGCFNKSMASAPELFVKGLASYEGSKWAKHRQIINPAFHMEKLKGMLPAFSTCLEEMIEQWHMLVDSIDSCELDVLHEFEKVTGDVISRAAFGSNFQEGRLIFSLQKEQARLFLQSITSFNFPWSSFYRFFMPTKTQKRMKCINKEVKALLRGMIEKRKKAIQLGIEDKDDLLSLLLKSNNNYLRESKKPNSGMTTEDVIEECKLFYFAGHETTANLLSWTMILLSMHKYWQERGREEVLQVIGKNKPSFDDLTNLKMVNMILLEVLRLYPATSIIRNTNQKTKLGHLELPVGVQIYMPIHVVHRDPEQWGEVSMDFNPERFSRGILKASKDQASFFGFGWGPRMCIGQNFAMLEAKLALTVILQNFSFSLSPSYIHAPTVAVTLQPGHGAQIILHKLRP
ncbi:cytochrome P450 CYP72A616-like [Malania oleifera]|uniref:cytochrome P450 CYP72A616-like n=1 Tax=Malania oleifera TaxID=397392 RepID=UPI0025ADD3F1|nr:cytochrome P450 CYP72A616-like [Malania oleifera]